MSDLTFSFFIGMVVGVFMMSYVVVLASILIGSSPTRRDCDATRPCTLHACYCGSCS